MLHSNTLLSICRHICYTVTYTQTSKIMSDIKHHARRCAHFKYVWQRVYDCCVCQTQAKRASTIKIYIFFIICDYQFAVYGTQYTRFRINNSEKKVFFGLVVAFEYHFFIWRFKYVFSGRKLYPRQYFRWLHFEILNIWIFLYSMIWIFKALSARGFNQLKLFDQSKWNNKIADLKSVIQIGSFSLQFWVELNKNSQ